MAKKESTVQNVSRAAASVLCDGGARKTSKSLAGSVLAQTRTGKVTSIPLAVFGQEQRPFWGVNCHPPAASCESRLLLL